MEKAYQTYWRVNIHHGMKFSDRDGRLVEVLSPGILNENAGPDFFNALVRIDGRVWAGNVEIHIKASDWYRHHHSTDPAYDNVVLHVVGTDDTDVKRRDGSVLPQITLDVPQAFIGEYETLAHDTRYLRCMDRVAHLEPIYKTDWIESLATQRLGARSLRIHRMLEQYCGDWHRVAFIIIARALGFGINSEPFEMLARALPLNVLHHHCSSPFQLEALLFGQAGLLGTNSGDDYYTSLRNEYIFLSHKYDLVPIRSVTWKNARTRPANSPHCRIAQLAAYCHNGFELLPALLQCQGNLDRIRQTLSQPLSDYWHTHYSFNTVKSADHGPALALSSINLLCINAVAPLYYAYAGHRGDNELAQYAIEILDSLPPENNSIIRQWRNIGIVPLCARESQALMELYRNYCEAGKCTSCRWGV